MDGTALEEAPDPFVGRTIGGRYLVAERLGEGGMGAVYRGRHQLVGRDVALKFLAPRFARDAAARERFLREARAANRIDHEHIIEITDFGETSDGLVFLVMEYLDGEPLSKLVERGPLPAARALLIAWQLASALARAHELDVIHRDVKPDNVFVLERRGGDFVKLLDFGLAKVVGEQRLTATGKVLGTPEYLAPEQARGEPLTGQTDQYQLGCVLYEMLTGELPFSGSHAQVVLKHLQQPPAPPSLRRPDLPLPRELDALVLRMLAKHPSERFADAYHLADELRALLGAVHGRASSRPPRQSGTLSLPHLRARATQPWLDAAEEAWAARLAHFEALARRALGQTVPVRVREALAALRDAVALARSARASLGHNVLCAQEREDQLRATRLRLGHAADELGRDESRVSRRASELRAAVAQVRVQLDESAEPLAHGLDGLIRLYAEEKRITPKLAEPLRALGGQASLWLDAHAQLEPLAVRLSAAEREREDLAFQIAQLKGRFGILNAEAEAELGELRGQAEVLSRELSHALERVTEAAEAVVRVLGEVPELRELLFTSLPDAGERGAASGG